MLTRPQPLAGQAVAPNVTDAANTQATARRKRLESGGRNATFLTQTSVAAAADRSPATLTGLSGGGSGAGGA